VSGEVDFFAYTPFAASDTGLLLFQPDIASPSRLLWFDRAGKELGSVGEPDLYGSLRLSPDGKRLALDIFDSRRSRSEVWVVDLSSGARTKLVMGDSQNSLPIWSPDGDRVVFASDRKAKGVHNDIWVKSINGGTEELLLESTDDRSPEDWSRDGRFLSFSVIPASGRRNQQVWFADLVSGRKVTPFQTGALTQVNSRISPDGRWLAFDSDESGRTEVCVVSFPSGTGKWQVSAAGGSLPLWRGDGRELYFVSVDNKIMAAPVQADSSFHAGSPAPLFAIHPKSSPGVFDVTADGQRFLVNSLPADLSSPPLTLISNWPATLSGKK
jgi:Tol biopolymer transport system component